MDLRKQQFYNQVQFHLQKLPIRLTCERKWPHFLRIMCSVEILLPQMRRKEDLDLSMGVFKASEETGIERNVVEYDTIETITWQVLYR